MIRTVALSLFLISIIRPYTHSQCPTADLVLSTQLAIDTFSSAYPGCSNLPFGLTIDGDPDNAITNLNGLAQITAITGFLRIQNNSTLPNLAGLDNLTSVGGFLRILSNTTLSTLGQLANLSSVGQDLTIGNNAALPDLDGLDNLTTIGQYLSVVSNAQLTDLDALLGLSSISTNITIESNPTLANLSGLQNITSLAGFISIRRCDALSDLTGLQNISSISGNLTISINNGLTSLSGLDNIDPSGINWMWIQSNPQLSDCTADAVCDYLSDPGNGASISSNTTGCNDRTQVETACNLLPVELISFDVAAHPTENILSWRTATEWGNEGFAIERSPDGHAWMQIGHVAGHGNSTQEIRYHFVDHQPIEGKNYYRIKQIDLDGSIVYSKIIAAISAPILAAITIYPNPTQDFLRIRGVTVANVEIRNPAGRLFYTISGSNDLDVSLLPPGLYFASLKGEDRLHRFKFLKR